MVSVPVLSEQITVTEPRVSTEESFLMIAFPLTKSLAPRVSVAAVIARVPLGPQKWPVTATMKALVAASRAFSPVSSLRNSRTKIRVQTRSTTLAMLMENQSIFYWRGVSASLTSWMRLVIFPNSVLDPVAVSTVLPRSRASFPVRLFLLESSTHKTKAMSIA